MTPTATPTLSRLFKSTVLIISVFLITQATAQTWVQKGQNIEGSNDERLGLSASLSGDGSLMVTGSDNRVLAYQYNNYLWSQKGSEISIKGASIDINRNGDSFIIGDGEFQAGKAQVFYWNGADWEQRGPTIQYTETTNYLGLNVAMNAAGNIIVVAGNKAAQVFQWNGESWDHKGERITFNSAPPTYSGVSLSDDGQTVAVGNKVYVFTNDDWEQKGNALIGNTNALSADGNRIVLGLSTSQEARIYEWQTDEWVQIGDLLTGKYSSDLFGSAVDMTPDGNTIAIGDNYSNAGGYNNGEVYIYDWSGADWIIRPETVTGNANLGNLADDPKSVDISDDGKYIVGGAYYANSGQGRTTIYTWCPGTVLTEDIVTCGDSYTWQTNNQNYTNNGSYSHSLFDADSCELFYQLNLTFADTAIVDTTVHICDSDNYTWAASGITYTDAGQFNDTLAGVSCPTIYNMNFSKGTSSSTSIDVIECYDTYLWTANGEFYSQSGNYQTVLTNNEGCDSAINLNLTLYPIPTVTGTIHSCDSEFVWSSNGETYYEEGIYTDTLSGVTGCDSINVIHLFFQVPNLDTSAIAFGVFTSPYTNIEYTTSGQHVENLNINGCPVSYTIDLDLREIAPMNGNYTIDPSGNGDFPSFSIASEALSHNGVDGWVQFNVIEGVYDESFTINTIGGASEINTVSFIGESDRIRLQPTQLSTDFIIYLKKVSHINFKNIYFDYSLEDPIDFVVVDGPAENISFDSCQFVFNQSAKNYSYYKALDSDSIENIRVSNSQFYGGTTSLYTKLCENVYFTTNNAQDIWITTSTNVQILNNEFNHSGSAYGMYMDECLSFTITGNKINKGYPNYNTLYIDEEAGDDIRSSIISNNMIYTPSSIELFATDSIQFLHNTIVSEEEVLTINSKGTLDTIAFNSVFKNNILVAGSGSPVIISSGEFSDESLDHNLYYTEGSILINHNGTDYSDLDSWKTAFNTYDQNSQSFQPNFVSDSNLHILSDIDYRFGEATTIVAIDIDGEARDLSGPVDVGADQYSGIVTNTSEPSNSILSSTITAYPNPSHEGIFHLSEEANWEIRSTSGVLLKNGHSSEIDLRDQANGIFFVQINGQTEKLMKR